MSAATVARLKITLDSVKPAVLRRVEVPFDIRLDRLHLTIQAAMGWTNSHLYELRARDVGWSTPLPGIHGGGDFLDARKARLDDVLEDIGTKTLRIRLRLRRWLGAHDHDRTPGDDFDPDDDEAEALTAQVALLAKTWSRTPVKKRTRTQ